MDSNSSATDIGDKILNTDIIDLLGLDKLPDAEKEKARQQISETIENRVFNRLEEEMEKSGKFELYTKALEAGGETFDNFLAEHKVDINQMFLEEALGYKVQLKSAADLLDAGIKVEAVKNGQTAE